MERKTQVIVAIAVIALGGGAVALGFLNDESKVQYVENLVDEPDEYANRSVTLIGMLQPKEFYHVNGSRENLEWSNSIQTTQRIESETGDILRFHTIYARQVTNTTIEWSMIIAERQADSSAEPQRVGGQDWLSEGSLLQVDSFETGQKIWAVYNGSIQDIERKPSQMEGKLMLDVPDGAIVFQIDTLAQQCSSKFVPPELRDEFDKDGDGLTD